MAIEMLFVFLLLLLPFCCQSALIASSAEQRSLIVNGVPQTVTVITISANQFNNEGTFQIGECTGTVNVLPPSYNYQYQVVGRIPKDVIPHVENVCRVSDINAYQQSLAANGEELSLSFNINGQIEEVVNADSSPMRRRLLAPLGPQGELSSNGAYSSSDNSITKSSQNYANDPLTQALLNGNQISWSQQTEIMLLNSVAKLYSDTFNLTAYGFQLLVQSSQNTDAALRISTQFQVDTYTQISANLTSLFNVQYQQLLTNNVTFAAIQGLFSTLAQFIDLENIVEQSVFSAIQGLLAYRLADQAEFYSYLDKDEMYALQSALMWKDIDNLPTGYFPLVYNEGVRPSTLTTDQLGFLIDIISTGYVRATPFNGGTSYSYYQHKFFIWMNTDFALQWKSSDLDFRVFATLFSSGLPSGCNINSSPTNCNVWVTLIKSSCLAIDGTYGQTYFQTHNDINEADCVSYSGNNNPFNETVPATIVVAYYTIRTFTQLTNILNNRTMKYATPPNGLVETVAGVCDGTPRQFIQPNYFQLYINSWRNQLQFSTNVSLTVCYLPLYGQQNSQIAYGILNNGTNNGPLYYFAALLESAFPQSLSDLARFRLIKYGRQPGSETFSVSSTIHTPTQYDNVTGQIIPNGDATPIECGQTRWSAISKETLPVYNYVQYQQGFVDTTIQVSVTCPVCPGCIEVTNIPVTTTLTSLTDYASAALPPSFLQVGDPNGDLYDVPASQLQVSGVLDARPGVSYLLYPPDVLESPDLPTFIAKYGGGGVYTATKATVSAQAFQVPKSITPEGYPYCSIYNGEPLTVTDNMPIVPVVCESPFVWSIPPFPSNACGVTGIALIQPNITTQLINQAFALSFYYQEDDQNELQIITIQAVDHLNPALVVSWGLALGIPILTVNNTPTSITNLKPSLVDGYPHHVLWVIVYVGSSWVVQSYVDGRVYGTAITISMHGWSNQILFTNITNSDTPVIYPTTSVSPLQQAVCQQSYRQIYQCVDYGVGSISIATLHPIPRTPGTLCGQFQPLLLYTNPLTSINPIINTTTFLNESFMITFFIYITTATPTTTTLFTLGNTPYPPVTCVLSNVNVITCAVSGTSVVANNIVTNPRPYFVSIASDIVAQTVSMYINGVLVRISGFGTSFPTVGNGTTFVNNSPKYLLYSVNYFSQLLPIDVLAELNDCQFTDLHGPSIGSCSTTGDISYCDAPTLCNGRCSQLSVVAGGLFTGYSNQCDNGFLPPDCILRCDHTDPVSGLCLDNTIPVADAGLIAGGSVCDRLRSYGAYYNNYTGLATFSAYTSWTMGFQIVIPTAGVYADLITLSTEVCPVISMARDGAGTLYLSLNNNDNNIPVQALVQYGPADPTAACSTPCCNANGTVVSVTGGRSLLYPIPVCPFQLMEITVSLVTNIVNPLSGLVSCFSASGQGLANQYQQAGSALAGGSVVYQFDVFEQTQSQYAIQQRLYAIDILEQYSRSHYGLTAKQQELKRALQEQRDYYTERLEAIKSITLFDTPLMPYNATAMAEQVFGLLDENAIIYETVQNDVIAPILANLVKANAYTAEVDAIGLEVLVMLSEQEQFIGSVMPYLNSLFNPEYNQNANYNKDICAGLTYEIAYENSKQNLLNLNFDLPGLSDYAKCKVEEIFEDVIDLFSRPAVTGSEEDCSLGIWDSLVNTFTPGADSGSGITDWLSCLFESVKNVLMWVAIAAAIALFLVCCAPQILEALCSCCCSAFDRAKSAGDRYNNRRKKSKKKYDKVVENSDDDETESEEEEEEKPKHKKKVKL